MWSKIKSLFTQDDNPAPAGSASVGRIKFFNRRRGYGFIEAESLDRDVFVHVTDLEDRVSKGDQVTFDIEPSEKGLEAKNVRLVKV